MDYFTNERTVYSAEACKNTSHCEHTVRFNGIVSEILIKRPWAPE